MINHYATRMRKTLTVFDAAITPFLLNELEKPVRQQLLDLGIPALYHDFSLNVSVGTISRSVYFWERDAERFSSYDELISHPGADIVNPNTLRVTIENATTVNGIDVKVYAIISCDISIEDRNFLGAIGKITTVYDNPREVLACGV